MACTSLRQSQPERGRRDRQRAGEEHPWSDEPEVRRAGRATGPSSACQRERGACQWSDGADHREAREGGHQGVGQRERAPGVRQSGDEVGRHALREAGPGEGHRRVQGDRGGCRAAHGAGPPGEDQWAGCPTGGHGEGRGLGAMGPSGVCQWEPGAFQ